MADKVEFPNLRSRLLIGPMFKRQFIMPEDPPRMLESFLVWYEKRVLKVDLTDISASRPIFLIGLPRSGTSMLHDLLANHPDIAYVSNTMHQFRRCFCAAEVLRKKFNLNAKGERYLGDSVEVDAGTPNDGVGFWGEWLDWDPHSLAYQPHTAADYTAEKIEQMKLAMRKIKWCFHRPNMRFLSKNPGLIPEIELLAEIFPDAKFIQIVRDARMCANSMRKLYRLEQEQLERIRADRSHASDLASFNREPFVPFPRIPTLEENAEKYGVDDIRTTAHLWNDAISYVNERRDKLPSFHEVRYEDILENPRDEVLQIFDFCELPPIAEDNQKFWDKLSKVGVTHHKNTYGDFDVIEEICRANMQRYKYC